MGDRPTAPTIEIVTWPGQPMLDAYEAGIVVWSPLGFDTIQDSTSIECPRRWHEKPRVTDCTIAIGIKRDPMLRDREGTNAVANRAERSVVIDSRVTNDLDLLVAVAHEIGHVVLDTSEHTDGGVMGGTSAQLESVDYELACRAVGLCVER